MYGFQRGIISSSCIVFSPRRVISVIPSMILDIKTSYIKGPLKNLHTQWKFKQLNKEKSKVIFIIEFEFKNFIHQKIAELFFPLIETKMLRSFIARVEKKLD